MKCRDWFVKPHQHHLCALEMGCFQDTIVSAQIRALLGSVRTDWNVSFQNIPLVHVPWNRCWTKEFQRSRVLRAALSPRVASYKLSQSELQTHFLGAACRTIVRDKSIPESSLESCLLLCVSHKEAICSQCAFVFITMLLCFACGHHFILRILMCSINSNNHVRVCTLLTEIKTETWWIPAVTCSLITELVGYRTCFQQQWALAQNQSLGRLRNIPQSSWLMAPYATRGPRPSSEISVIVIEGDVCKEHKTSHACRF